MNKAGSEWNRWDMHIHTPGTLHEDEFQGGWEEYDKHIESARPSVKALGITDYFTLSSYKKALERQQKGGFKNIWLFPNIELRLDTQAKSWINFHLIFSPEDPNHIEEIEDLLRNLTFEDKHGNNYCLSDTDLIKLGRKCDPRIQDDKAALREGAKQFKVDRNQIKKIQQMPWSQKNMVTAVSSKSNDGTSGIRKSASELAGYIEARSNIIFSGNESDREFWMSPNNGMSPKPVIFSCDAHSNERILKPSQNKFCWLKGDICFDTIRQILIEPERRVYIGEHPQSPSYATINSIRLKNADWFPEEGVVLNNGLVAIIGARGSGKTALADLVSLGANTLDKTDEQSFITRAQSYLNGIEIDLEWSGDASSVEFCDIPSFETDQGKGVKYLSQHFVNRICSHENKGELQSEIEKMIFSSLDVAQKRNCISFQELESQILEPVKQKKQECLTGMGQLNTSILSIGDRLQSEPQIKKNIESNRKEIELKKKDIASLLEKTTKSKQDVQKISNVIALIKEIQSTRENDKAKINQQIDSYNILKQKISSEQNRMEQVQNSWKTEFSASELGLNEVWSHLEHRFSNEVYRILDEKIDSRKKKSELISKEKADVEREMNVSALLTYNYESLKDLPDSHLVFYEEQLSLKLSALGIHSEKYSNELQNLARLNQSKDSLQGSIEEVESLKSQLKSTLADRRQTYIDFFDAISNEETILESLHSPLRKRLETVGGTCDELEFYVRRVVDLESWLSRGREFFDNRSFNLDSSVANAQLYSIFQSGTKDQVFSAINSFHSDNIDAMKSAKKDILPWDKPNKWGHSVAEWLFSLEHIKLEHGIRYQGVSLEQLSSGTKGIVLLLLYLIVDNEDQRPLIIDQPEENLDPNSIFRELVEPFRHIREKRQVIIVTHNANLVVNTDVDQVIVAKNELQPDGQGLPRFNYISGSIENKEIRDLVCLTLEGGAQAFLDREKRYRLQDQHKLNLN